MVKNNSSNRQKSSRKTRRKRSLLPWFLVVLGLVASLLFYFLYIDKTAFSPGDITDNKSTALQENENSTTDSVGYQSAQNESQSSDSALGEASIDEPNNVSISSTDDPSPAAEQNIQPETAEDGESDITGSASNADNTVSSCEPSLTTIQKFYTHLDNQEYLKPYQMDKPSELYFSELLQKVVDNPPIVTGETDDLFNILKNTAHFFRIVGKKNIFILKAILDREKDSFEKVLADFYKLTSRPACLKNGFNLTIPETALYDYAGFFLNTMGGRLYLFRRDSVSRMAVSYYSILIVDQANQNGTNKHGIDIAPSIKSLISELENSGAQLRMRDDYLDVLYLLETKYI